MNTINDIIVSGADDRPVLMDLHYPEEAPGNGPLPMVIFAHGFKGFKDWGIWELLARSFTDAGYAFLKFNFSHNGTTPESPSTFSDLKAFGRNTFSRELADLEAVLNWVAQAKAAPGLRIDTGRLALIGHSRGGAIALLQGLRDERVQAVITWASVSRLDYAWQDEALIKEWREKGVHYITNARTGQDMPLYFSLYEDFDSHREEFDIQKALSENEVPLLIVHGDSDPAVPAHHAHDLHRWAPWSQLVLIEGADHVFGGRHPWPEENLPEKARELSERCITFLHKTL